MKTVVFKQYGPPNVLQIQERMKPVPKDREVLIKVYATTVTATDCLMRQGEPRWGRVILGLRKPRPKREILGLELAGEVEAVGSHVTRFQVGDQVVGFTGFGSGAYAEYNCMSEAASLAHKPCNISYAEAAAVVDGATTALFFLQDLAQLQSGEHVLINGASGSIGTYAVQLASYFGAHVTGVCSTRNIDLVKSLGADKVIDYTQTDFTSNQAAYDVIFDTVGKSSWRRCKTALKPNGRYLSTTGLHYYFLTAWTRLITRLPWGHAGKKVVSGMSINKAEALKFLTQLLEDDQLKIVIDRTYAIEQIVEAHRYVDQGHKRGNVVMLFGDHT